MAASGKTKLWFSGPPCRTTSALGCKHDDGQQQLRARSGPQRFGLEDLSMSQQQKTDDDTVMWLRSLWWMLLSHQSSSDGEYLLEQPRDADERHQGPTS